MRQFCELGVSVRTHAKVRQSMGDGNGHDVAINGGHSGWSLGELRGFVIHSPTKVFHLARRQDGLAVRHVGTLVDNQDDGAKLSADVCTSSDKG